ncbi:MAG: hypothetical protein K2F83_07025, partial [Oscillospiraceae bacterium]|nr:hypothetical protein [Oscillospiraceae bacterium]
MARGSGKKENLIKCEYCGEMYSTTYKHCPFCNEDGTSEWAEPEEEQQEEEVRPAGGKRLASGSGGGYYEPPQKPKSSRGGGRGHRNLNISPWSVLGVILSLALIIAAVCIVVNIFRSIT